MIEDLHDICPDNSEYIVRLQFDRVIFHPNDQHHLAEVDHESKLYDHQPPNDCGTLIRHVHVQFGSLLKFFQKIIDFEQLLRWARTTVDQCVFKVSFRFVSLKVPAGGAICRHYSIYTACIVCVCVCVLIDI